MSVEMTRDRAKAYQRQKQVLHLVHLAVSPAILLLAAVTPVSRLLHQCAVAAGGPPYAVLSFYFLFLSLFLMIFDLPFDFYSGFILEHRFGLSNQNLRAWIADFLKRSVLSFVFSLAMIAALYALIWHYPAQWWVIAWAAYAVVGYVFGKLFPVLIVPLFYKYSPVEDGFLRERIFALAKRYGMPVGNVYSLNLSRKTKKANAAFMGIGRTKRVILSDTLLANFTPEEIESVLAHELGHYKHRDIWRQLGFGLVASFISFLCIFLCIEPVARGLGYGGAGDLGAMPVLFLAGSLLGLVLTPLQSAFSRRMERAADRFSLEAFAYPDIFISAMEKLGALNLADPSPHPVYEWFFYSHPSIPKRVAMARNWKRT
ncbi:MAG: M48 family metallopeptidase [Candidatus Omnitrophota bacterium]